MCIRIDGCALFSTVLLGVLLPQTALAQQIAPAPLPPERYVAWADDTSPSGQATESKTGEEGDELDHTKARLLEKWVGNPDGGAGQRVRQVVEEVVYEHRRAN